jgi:protein-disulfide isomerase
MRGMILRWATLGVVVCVLSVALSLGWNPEQSDVLALGQEVRVDRRTVEEALQNELSTLELDRLRFDAEQKRKKHQLVELKVKELVADRLFELEAAERGITTQDIFAEVNALAEPPTPEEIDELYEANKERMREPKEAMLPQIERFLKQQKARQTFIDYIEALADKYEVTYNLEPLRFEVRADGYPALGPADAPVTIVEFSDFECPHCARVGPTLKKIAEDYGDKVRLVFRHFPLASIHRVAQEASEASLCAADQGKFWEMHDAIFADQRNLSVERLKEMAGSLGLDRARFDECLDSNRYADKVLADVRDGARVGVTGTPAFFVNGRPLSGAVPYETIAETVEEELAALEVVR